VLGIRERCGRTKAVPISNTSAIQLQSEIRANIVAGSTIHTDEHSGYTGLSRNYTHETISHSTGEYVRDNVTTNGIESVWALLKRGLTGTYHHASEKHLHRYVNEFTFRLNDGTVKRHTLDRLSSLMTASFGPRLTYKALKS
jgi:transposase-like protein